MTEAMVPGLIRIVPESLTPRERLSDEEMGNFLSFVGNHEAKAITIIIMRNGNVFNKGNLWTEVLSAQGDDKGWRMDRGIPFQYCSHDFVSIGLVKETLSGYTITDEGKKLGIPLAGLLLDFSERHNIPLSLLFGPTLSGSKSKTVQTKEGKDIEFRKRSPLTTLRIIHAFVNSPTLPIGVTDLEKRIKQNTPDDVSTHLARLSKLGLIQYTSVEANKPFTSYKLPAAIPEGELPIYGKHRILTESVFDILKNHPDQYLTIKDIYNLLPKKQVERWKSVKANHGRISRVLSHLTKHKYADIGKFYGGKQSEINISQGQRIVLTEVLEIVDGFQSQNKETLEKGKRLAREIIINPERVSNLVRRAKEASSYTNRFPQKKAQRIILSFISANPNGITNKEIQKLLEEKCGKRLTAERVSSLSFSLLKNGSVKAEKEGSVNIFYPNNKT